MSGTFAKGFSAAGVAAGISSVEGKKDLALVVNQGPLDSAAGVFTFNRFCAAPVQWSRKTVADGHIKAVILNSGGANACTGQAGYEQSAATAKKVAELVGTQPDEIAVCSTGLIGDHARSLDHAADAVSVTFQRYGLRLRVRRHDGVGRVASRLVVVRQGRVRAFHSRQHMIQRQQLADQAGRPDLKGLRQQGVARSRPRTSLRAPCSSVPRPLRATTWPR